MAYVFNCNLWLGGAQFLFKYYHSCANLLSFWTSVVPILINSGWLLMMLILHKHEACQASLLLACGESLEVASTYNVIRLPLCWFKFWILVELYCLWIQFDSPTRESNIRIKHLVYWPACGNSLTMFANVQGLLWCVEIRHGEWGQRLRGKSLLFKFTCASTIKDSSFYLSFLFLQVIVSGKLRAQRAKSMKFKDGYMISSGQPVNEYIDSAVRHVLLRQVCRLCRFSQLFYLTTWPTSFWVSLPSIQCNRVCLLLTIPYRSKLSLTIIGYF